MNATEAAKLASKLGKLFPMRVNQDQSRWLIEQFRPMEFSSVDAAIDKHRRERSVDSGLDFPSLLADCLDRKAAASTVKREGSWSDVYRRANPKLAQAGDVEVILRTHRGWWYQARQSAYEHRPAEWQEHEIADYVAMNPDRFVSCRRRFRSSALGCLITAFGDEAIKAGRKIDEAEGIEIWQRADRLADAIFSDPHYFDMSLRDLRGELSVV